MAVADEGGGTGSIVFRMSDDANEYVIADAVMVGLSSGRLLVADVMPIIELLAE